MRRILILAGLLLISPGASQNAVADEHSLRSIMQELGVQIGRLAEAMMADDLATVGEAATAIADHPRPGLTERLSVLGRLGSDAASFRQRDADVHDAALRIKQAAEAGDRSALADDFHRLTDACLSCHRQFRDVLRSTDTRESSTP